MTGSRDDGAVDDTRRYLLQTVGGALTAGLAGCTGGNNGGSERTATETEALTPRPTPTATPTPEAEHADITEMAHNWAQQVPTEGTGNALGFDTYSPQQLNEKYDQVRPVLQTGPVFEMLPYSREEPPESFRQTFSRGDPNHRRTLRVDQLPSGVSEEDVAQGLEDSGYKHEGPVNGFDVYFNPIKGSVHALGENRHAFTFDYAGLETTTETLKSTLEDTLESYGTDVFTEDMKAAQDALDMQDSFGMFVDQDFDYITGFDDKYGPSLGASTLDVDRGALQSAWVFDNAGDAAFAQAYLEDGNIGGGYQTVNQESDSRVLTAIGKDNQAIQDMKDGEAVIGMPQI
ncbi:hypothetical protein [Haloplanus natans]|uniref:hypothetical protein n=1 Tax=Haloplanus natans TaxID=376171 RepID=UPI0012FB90EE|nr:hypothetical protein [Haloplanus natans]